MLSFKLKAKEIKSQKLRLSIQKEKFFKHKNYFYKLIVIGKNIKNKTSMRLHY